MVEARWVVAKRVAARSVVASRVLVWAVGQVVAEMEMEEVVGVEEAMVVLGAE